MNVVQLVYTCMHSHKNIRAKRRANSTCTVFADPLVERQLLLLFYFKKNVRKLSLENIITFKILLLTRIKKSN